MTLSAELAQDINVEITRNQLAIYGTTVTETSAGPQLFDYVFPAM